MDFLQQMAERSRARVIAAKQKCSHAEMFERAERLPDPPRLRFSGKGFDLIAEIKLRSPASGALESGDMAIEPRAAAYGSADAAAVSVLTEPSRFDGSMEHLESAARALAPLHVPAMRKDFLVDPYQMAEARVAGAGGALVILRMLTCIEVEALIDAARLLRMFVLLEAFDEHDIALALELVERKGKDDMLVGVNCRDLTSLQVVPGRLAQLASLLPTNTLKVAESGIATLEDARNASAAGYDLALVGSALMQARDPASLMREMLAAGAKQ
jgi:indole-3-glycerol phosphate synthase